MGDFQEDILMGRGLVKTPNASVAGVRVVKFLAHTCAGANSLVNLQGSIIELPKYIIGLSSI